MNVEVKERLESALDRYGLSQAQAARDMGYSGSVISAYRTGSYQGDIEKLEDGIIKWLARQIQARAYKRVPIVETDDLRRITNAIQIAHTEKDIALIVAEAGAGKSTAAHRYAKDNEKTTVLVQIFSGMNKKMLVQEIAKQLAIETTRTSLNVLIKNVSDALCERDMVVILDEAEYLKADALEFTRRLVYDLGKSGMVLIGLPALAGLIQNSGKDHHQLESRIGVYLPLSGLTKKDATVIAKSVWANIETKIIDAIYAISKTDVRQFTKIIERMQGTLLINKIAVPDLEVVETAASLIMRRKWR